MQGASAFDLFRERNGFLRCNVLLGAAAAFQADRRYRKRPRRDHRAVVLWHHVQILHISEGHWIDFMMQQYDNTLEKANYCEYDTL